MEINPFDLVQIFQNAGVDSIDEDAIVMILQTLDRVDGDAARDAVALIDEMDTTQLKALADEAGRHFADGNTEQAIKNIAGDLAEKVKGARSNALLGVTGIDGKPVTTGPDKPKFDLFGDATEEFELDGTRRPPVKGETVGRFPGRGEPAPGSARKGIYGRLGRDNLHRGLSSLDPLAQLDADDLVVAGKGFKKPNLSTPDSLLRARVGKAGMRAGTSGASAASTAASAASKVSPAALGILGKVLGVGGLALTAYQAGNDYNASKTEDARYRQNTLMEKGSETLAQLLSPSDDSRVNESSALRDIAESDGGGESFRASRELMDIVAGQEETLRDLRQNVNPTVVEAYARAGLI